MGEGRIAYEGSVQLMKCLGRSELHSKYVRVAFYCCMCVGVQNRKGRTNHNSRCFIHRIADSPTPWTHAYLFACMYVCAAETEAKATKVVEDDVELEWHRQLGGRSNLLLV